MYKQLKSSLLNLETVLNYFGITQEQYFNLDVIPFPIVNAEGAPVYLNNENKLVAYSSSPLSLVSASAYSVNKEEQLYVFWYL